MNKFSHRMPPRAGILAIAAIFAMAFTVSSLATLPQRPRALTAVDKIEAAVVSAKLDHHTAALYKLYAVKAPGRLPVAYQPDVGAPPLRCGTQQLMEAREALLDAPEETRLAASALVGRPNLQFSYDSPGGQFKIHYSLSGGDAVAGFDFDSSGFPDYVELVAWAADSSWRHQVVNLGWRPPPTDGTAGGDSRYDIYCIAMQPYGYTEIAAAGPEPWGDQVTFVVIRRDFHNLPPNNDPAGSDVGSLKATVAHEFNHACQFACRAFDQIYWFELSATYMEEVVFGEVNDNYQFLDDYYDLPWTSLYDDGLHMYGAFPYALRLAALEHDTLIRDCWEAAKYLPVTDAIDSVLISRGSSYTDEFVEFCLWNYYTGSRDDGQHYAEGLAYPEVPISSSPPFYPFTDFLSPPMEAMSADFRILPPHPNGRALMLLTFDGVDGRLWRVQLTQHFDGGSMKELELVADSVTGEGTMYIPGFDTTTSLTMIAINATPIEFGGSGSYRISADFIISGDVNDDGNINIIDITYLIDHVFRLGPEPVPDPVYGDGNCDTVIDVLDVIVLIDYVFRSGPEPCPPLLF